WSIAAAVIGGTSLLGGEGTILGALLGAGILGVMQNGMVLENVSSYLQEVILGVVLVVAVVYATLRRRFTDRKVERACLRSTPAPLHRCEGKGQLSTPTHVTVSQCKRRAY